MVVKLVALDLDGTLLHDDMSISAYTKNVIKKVQNKGIKVIVATGRTFSAARLKTEELKLGEVPVICYTGAWVMMNYSGMPLMKEEIPPKTVKKILEIAKKSNRLAYVFHDDIAYLPEPHPLERLYEKYRAEKTKYIGENFYHPTKTATRIIFADLSKAVRDEIREIIERNFSDEVEVFFPGDDFVDIYRKGVSKGTALSILCNQWKITPEEVAAFGNTENDISMFQFADSSWAVSNADEIAKNVAKKICLSNNEDGVAHVLEKMIE